MKLLTLNFLTCAVKTCKTNPASFPLHPRETELEIVETDLNLAFLKNILPRVLWEEVRGICTELGLPALPSTPPTPADLVEPSTTTTSTSTSTSTISDAATADARQQQQQQKEEEEGEEQPSQTAKDLHRILIETHIQSGKLVCAACEHEYAVKEGVANFLLPGHLV